MGELSYVDLKGRLSPDIAIEMLIFLTTCIPVHLPYPPMSITFDSSIAITLDSMLFP